MRLVQLFTLFSILLLSQTALAVDAYQVHSKFKDGSRDTYIASLLLMQKPKNYTDLHKMPGQKEMRFTFLAKSYSTRSFVRHLGSWAVIGSKDGAFGKDVKASSTEAIHSLKDKIYAKVKRRQLINGDYFSIIATSKSRTNFYINGNLIMKINDPALFSYLVNMWVSPSSAVKYIRPELLSPTNDQDYKALTKLYDEMHDPVLAKKAKATNPEDKAAIAAQKRQALVARKKDYQKQLEVENAEKQRVEQERLLKIAEGKRIEEEKLAKEAEAKKTEQEQLDKEKSAQAQLPSAKEKTTDSEATTNKTLVGQTPTSATPVAKPLLTEKDRIALKLAAAEKAKKEAEKLQREAELITKQAAMKQANLIVVDTALPDTFFKATIKSEPEVLSDAKLAFNKALIEIDKSFNNIKLNKITLYCTEQGEVIEAIARSNKKLEKVQIKQIHHAAQKISPIAISAKMVNPGIYALNLE